MVIKPGDDIFLAIEHGLEASRVLVLCLSPAALGSDWVALERSTVLFRDPANRARRFVPLLLADCGAAWPAPTFDEVAADLSALREAPHP
jgi:hypothetical protein